MRKLTLIAVGLTVVGFGTAYFFLAKSSVGQDREGILL